MENYLKSYKDEDVADKKLVRMVVIVMKCTKLLPKSIWELFERRIENDDFFYALLGLNSIKSDTIPLHFYINGLLYNPALFERVMLSDDIEWLNSTQEE